MARPFGGTCELGGGPGLTGRRRFGFQSGCAAPAPLPAAQGLCARHPARDRPATTARARAGYGRRPLPAPKSAADAPGQALALVLALA